MKWTRSRSQRSQLYDWRPASCRFWKVLNPIRNWKFGDENASTLLASFIRFLSFRCCQPTGWLSARRKSGRGRCPSKISVCLFFDGQHYFNYYYYYYCLFLIDWRNAVKLIKYFLRFCVICLFPWIFVILKKKNSSWPFHWRLKEMRPDTLSTCRACRLWCSIGSHDATN